MTDREKAIVMAYTGIAMLTGDKLNIFYEYLSELYHRPVYTHEIPNLDIKEKATQDFLDLCKNDDDKFKKRTEVVIHQLREDNERLNELIEDIKEEITDSYVYFRQVNGETPYVKALRYCLETIKDFTKKSIQRRECGNCSMLGVIEDPIDCVDCLKYMKEDKME